MIVEWIKELLQKKMELDYFEFKDDTQKHAHHKQHKPGTGHYVLTAVSAAFAGMALLERHRLVYDLVDMKKYKIHSLSLKLYSIQEWKTLPKNNLGAP